MCQAIKRDNQPCRYKPNQQYCGIHDPNRYHKRHSFGSGVIDLPIKKIEPSTDSTLVQTLIQQVQILTKMVMSMHQSMKDTFKANFKNLNIDTLSKKINELEQTVHDKNSELNQYKRSITHSIASQIDARVPDILKGLLLT